MTLAHGALLFVAALIAGVLNSVAGGGSFFSFPALIFTGVAPIQANATSTIALWPGSLASVGAYWKRLPGGRGLLVPLIAISLIGGILGAVLLIKTPQSTFMHLVPYLFLVATFLLAFGRQISERLNRTMRISQRPRWVVASLAVLVQLGIAIYGGFFGGGIGILMLALLTMVQMQDIHGMNAVKTLLATTINAAAVVTFILARVVIWPQALLMIVAAASGGYGGAHYAQKMDPNLVRRFAIAVGLGMAVYFLLRR